MIGGLEAKDLGRAGKKKKWVAGLDGGMVRVWFGFFHFLFFLFLFNLFTQNLIKFFKKDFLTTPSIKSVCIQHDAQTLGYFLN
jgi:hypothetical protein